MRSSPLIRTILVLLALSGASIAVDTRAFALDWSIDRNFRYFKHESDVAIQRVAYDVFLARHGKAPTIEEQELLINGGDFWDTPFPATPAMLDLRRKWPFDWRLSATPYALLKHLRDPNRPKVPDAPELDRLGWASLLTSRPQDAGPEGGTEVCWSATARRHANCAEYGDHYALPRGWVVRIHDPDAAAADICQWTANAGIPATGRRESDFGAPGLTAFPQAGEVAASCLEFSIFVPAQVGADGKVTGHAKVTRTRAGGPPLSIDVTPRDILVIGVGDSMTSGEGNPEQPATFDARNDGVEDPDTGRRSGHFWATRDTLLPVRFGGDAANPENRAQWTDRRCHRSVYSWQARAALHLALGNRQQSVTLLQYGCSGAEVFEGLLYRYDGVEPGAATLAQGHPATLGLLYQELCKAWKKPAAAAFGARQPSWQDDKGLMSANFETSLKAPLNRKNIVDHLERDVLRCDPARPQQEMLRSADVMLMAIGINDIGFSKWVAGAMTTGGIRTLAGGFIPGAADAQTQRRLKRLAWRYDILKQALDTRVFPQIGLVPAGTAASSPLPQALVLSYPVSLRDAHGAVCANGNQSMTAATFRSALFGGEAKARACGYAAAPNATGAVFAMRNAADMQAIESFALARLNGGVRDFAASGAFKYTVVEAAPASGDNKFDKRGFCATTDSHSAIPAGQKCLSWGDFGAIPPGAADAPNPRQAAAESLHVARDGPVFGAPGPGLAWRPFAAFPKTGAGLSNYALFYPYASRTRLFRTVNDVYMLINRRGLNSNDTTSAGLLDLLGRTTSGAYHPTAEGHAIVGAQIFDALPAAVR